jgi:septation ring formation regulator EzrA
MENLTLAILVVLVIWAIYHSFMEAKQDQRLNSLEEKINQVK